MIPGLTTKVSESVVASTTSIVAKTDVIFVSGTTSVATIVPNFGGGFSGILIIIATDVAGFATTTAGNINAVVSLTTGKPTLFVFSKVNNKWYPGAIS